ncbi:MAG: hypothetical protein WAQ52_20105 [Terriglobales bacterium]
MDRRGSVFLLILAISSLAALCGCVGKSTSNSQNGGVQTVTLNPSTDVSLELGRTQTFSATARNAAGQSVFATIHFTAGCTDQLPCAPVSIANNGVACAGSWDSLSNPVVCKPGVTGIATVTAEAEGVSSAPTTVYIHQHIQNIQVTPVGTPTADCFSQAVSWNFQATAYSVNNVDITNTVGPLAWSTTTGNVLTVDNIKGLPNNQIQVTAKDPGITQLFASVSGTTSTPLKYTTCLVQSIMLQVQNGSGNSVTINAGSTKTIEAMVVDTLNVTLSKPPLTWSTSNPEIATVSNSGVVTARQEAGAADISASCTPPSCNIGVLPGLPIYSTGGMLPNGQPAFGVIVTHVTQTKPPVATAFAATTDCNDAFNCTSVMFPVAAGANPVGASVTLPYTPNSLLFTPAGTRAYLGSSKGLMFVDFGQNITVNTVSQATTPCNVAVCGKPLTISADGNRVVVSDTTTNPNQVYIFDAAHASSAPVDLLIDGATAAAFSPDQMKIFILSNTGKMYVFSTVDSLLFVPISVSATGVSFAADGSFVYVAGTPGNNISGFSTCDIPPVGSVDLGNVITDSTPLKIFPLPDVHEAQIDARHSLITQSVIALEPPNLQLLTARFTRDPLDDPKQLTCNLPTLASFDPSTPVNLGQGNFTPLYTQVTGDGSQVILVAKNIPAVLVFDANGGTTSAFPLADSAFPFAATATLDGTQIFVAACDAFQNNDPQQPCLNGSVHIVDAQSGGDIQQAIYTNVNTNNSMCTNLDPTQPPCLPNLIAVRPQ